mmetsp:Transcript_10781/g.21418  ORF Transcript_10781/g.21418 Transcript_10781/m.21418 type:complete len:217 (-) Transcript_10781:181-831(-)
MYCCCCWTSRSISKEISKYSALSIYGYSDSQSPLSGKYTSFIALISSNDVVLDNTRTSAGCPGCSTSNRASYGSTSSVCAPSSSPITILDDFIDIKRGTSSISPNFGRGLDPFSTSNNCVLHTPPYSILLLIPIFLLAALAHGHHNGHVRLVAASRAALLNKIVRAKLAPHRCNACAAPPVKYSACAAKGNTGSTLSNSSGLRITISGGSSYPLVS